MSKFLKEKGIGFYLTVCLAVLAVVTAIVYAVSYRNYVGFMSWPAFWLLIGGAVLAVGLHFIKLGKVSPWLLAAAVLAAVLLYIECLYSYVVVVLVGIDLNSFSNQFILCTSLFGACLVLSIVNIYLKQVKQVKEEA
ncbi:MAG: hypothetical protein J6Z23_02010 [Lachnospiraceae bacterium]|nr:hypothetical protein [Lachnospiraceae bacterium]